MALGATEGEGPGRPCVGGLHGAAAQCCGAKGPGGAAIAAPAPLAPQCCGAMETANIGAHLAPSPLCGAKGHGATKLICGTRVHGTVAWARPLPCWWRGGLGATLAGSAVPPPMAPQSCAAVPWLVLPQNGLGFENTFGHRLFLQFF